MSLSTNDNPRSSQIPQAQDVDETETRVELGLHTTQTQKHNDHSIDNIEPYKLHLLMDKYPKASFCVALLLFILNGVIVLVLSKTGNLLEPSSEVPMYIRDNKAYQASDALKAGELDATYDAKASSSGASFQQSVSADVDLKLIYIIKDENDENGLMQHKYLQMMDEIEDKISNFNGYESKCKRVYSDTQNIDDFKCARHQTVTQFFDKNYFIGATNATYDSYPTLRNYIQYLSPSYIINSTINIENNNYSHENINKISEYWSGYGQGMYNNEEMPSTFHYMTPTTDGGFRNYTLTNVFRSITDYKFGETPISTRVSASMSIFSFGLPLDGFESHIDAVKTQEDVIGEWCYNHLDDMLSEYADTFDENGMIMRWGCSTMQQYAIFGLLQTDARLLMFTFLSVYILMVYNVNSFFLATFGMLMIFLNFLPSILLYRYITQLSYFGTLNILGMFIILAIGADDIFVLYDTWAQTRLKYEHVSVAKRLTFTLSHAAKVMATTSLSTIFSFIGNATSAFPAVYTFGVFSAWLVFVNYCAVVLFYPTVLVIHDKYFYTPTLKRPWCYNKACNISTQPYDNKNTRCTYNIKPDFNEDDTDKQRKIDRCFETSYYRCLLKFKYIILIVFGLVFIVFGYFASKLEPDPELPEIFPEGNNYQEYKTDLTTNFATETALQIENFIIFGLVGIDREGTDPTLSDDIGKPIYDSDLSIASADEQQYIAQLCDDLLCGYLDYDCRYNSIWSDLMISDPSVYGPDSELRVLKCFMTEFRDWVQTEDVARLNTTDIEDILIENGFINSVNASMFDNCEFDGTFPVQHKHCFAFLFALIWMNDELSTSNPDYTSGTTNYDYWKEYIWASSEQQTSNNIFGIEAQLRFIKISILLNANANTNYIEGIQLYDIWEQYITNWRDDVYGTVSVDNTNENFVVTPKGLQSISFTDTRKWQYFFLQKQIIREAFVGIFLSLTLAFFVLVIATNNYILSLMCIFVIFSIVVCVIGFVVMMGWKLGVIEAIVFVLVVGMSVDYVVHLSEAYLHSNKLYFKSVDKARSMLGIVGGSVLSGAISTIIGVSWLTLAQIGLLNKFGIIILFLTTTSFLFAICAFATFVSIFGPNGEKGNVAMILSRLYKFLCRCNRKEDNSLVGAVEMA